MRLGVLAALALFVAACDNGGHHGGHHVADADHPPVIANLSVTVLTPLVAGHQGVYEFVADVADPDGDLADGFCAVHTSIGASEVPLDVRPHDATVGTVRCVFETTVLGQVVSGSFTVEDRHGHVSNPLHFTIPAERTKPAGSAVRHL